MLCLFQTTLAIDAWCMSRSYTQLMFTSKAGFNT